MQPEVMRRRHLVGDALVAAGVTTDEDLVSVAGHEFHDTGGWGRRFARPLAGGDYDVSARGFLNLRLLAGGGDTTFVYEPPPPVPEEDPEEADASEEGLEAEEDGSEAPGLEQDDGEGAGA